MLGCIAPGTPLWVALCLIIVVTRTHVPTVAIAWLLGSVVRYLVEGWYAPAGALVLQAAPHVWQLLVQQPMVCYLNLDRARVMGSLVCGAAAGAVIAFIGVAAVLVVQRGRPRAVSA